MRVRYGELSLRERDAREQACSGARQAWAALARGDATAACAAMQRVDSRLRMVLAATETGATCVEIVPLESEAWPLAELCLSLAPAELALALSLGRAAVPLERALGEVRAAHGVDLRGCTLRAGFGRGHLLEVTLGLPGGSGAENEQNAAENLVRALLGDRLFETWVGAVHVVAAPRVGPLRVLDVTAPRASLGLVELFDTVAAAARGVLEGLPDVATTPTLARDEPCSVDARSDGDVRGDWTLLEVEPLASASGRRKEDLVLASTCTPELLRCYLDGAPCSSRRFSRSGERFVFLSYDDALQPMERRVARRTAIESALESYLRGDGRVTGVGFGLKTSYVDLALANLEAGLERLLSKLRQLGLPERSFIQFFDSELAEEWLSIWPDKRLAED
jgi:hypothetical protein